MTAPVDDVLRSLRAVQRRLFLQTLVGALGRSALGFAALLVVAGAILRWGLERAPWDPQLAGLAGLGTLATAILVAIFRRPSLQQTAQVIDHLGQTRDRFLTALDFSQEKSDPGLRDLAVQECAAFIRRGSFAHLVRLRFPRELIWLAVPLIALALLQWEARETLATRAVEVAAAQALVEETAKQLEELARQTERAEEKQPSDDLKRIAEELKRSAEQLRAEASNAQDAEKASLRELSELEKLLQELQKQAASMPTPQELRELAKALEKQEQTKDSAQALNEGDLGRAAESLEKAMKQLQEAGDEPTREQIEQALKEAVERVAQPQKQLSDAMEKLAKQAQQNGAQAGEQGQQLSKELADLLRQLAQQQAQAGQQGQPQRGPANPQSLKDLLAALQNLKHGSNPPNQGRPGDGPPQGIALQDFSKGGQPGEGGDPQMPSGGPGSEKDKGTTEHPFGKEQNALGEDARKESLSGLLGQGETLQQFLPGVADSSKSQRRYRELYDAMAPAAEDAVVQENIPLGSRFFIKRYFESIRPKE